MSKYEPRAEAIKEIARDYGWKISWKKQSRYVYVTIEKLPPRKPIENRNFPGIGPLLKSWYPDIEMTSGGDNKRTYRVFDIWKAMGGK